jgi:hypothetical protein
MGSGILAVGLAVAVAAWLLIPKQIQFRVRDRRR